MAVRKCRNQTQFPRCVWHWFKTVNRRVPPQLTLPRETACLITTKPVDRREVFTGRRWHNHGIARDIRGGNQGGVATGTATIEVGHCLMEDQQWARQLAGYIVSAAIPFAGALWAALTGALRAHSDHKSGTNVMTVAGSSCCWSHHLSDASYMQYCPTHSGTLR